MNNFWMVCWVCSTIICVIAVCYINHQLCKLYDFINAQERLIVALKDKIAIQEELIEADANYIEFLKDRVEKLEMRNKHEK